MCGICGIISIDTKSSTENDILKLVASIQHRGPDAQGIWLNKNNTVALGHSRLSILDLSDLGKQPMSYLNERYQMVLNGEIYNFIEIRQELINKGYAFKSETDTEVVIAAYHEWGIHAMDKFNGMWAFAIYDQLKNETILSRDRFGVKPLYYYKNDKKFIFASEVKAIHQHLGFNHPLDQLVVKNILAGKAYNQSTTKTYLKEVFTLPGGYYLTLKNGEIKIHEWYTLKKVTVPKSFEEQAIQLKQLLIDSCKLRLRSDVPVGTCLSGGVDSGSISAVISKMNIPREDRFNTFSHRSFCASFPNTPIDESKSASFLANRLGMQLDVVVITPPSKEDLEKVMQCCDGQMHAIAFYPKWKLYQHIKKQKITVTLDGQGPDEMLGGYSYVYDALKAAIELRKPFWFYDVYKTYASQGETTQWSAKKNAKKALKQVIISAAWLPFSKIKKWVLKNKKKSINEEQLQPVKINPSFTNTLDNSLYEQFFQDPLPSILNQYDRCSMASGVECRMPFMDYRIVEYIFSLPVESKVGNGYTKRVLREAMTGILPDEIRLNKQKIGFNAPIVDWFRGPLKDFMIEVMQSSEFLTTNYFDGKTIHSDFKLFLETEDPQWDVAWKFWPPVHFVWWANKNKINIC